MTKGRWYAEKEKVVVADTESRLIKLGFRMSYTLFFLHNHQVYLSITILVFELQGSVQKVIILSRQTAMNVKINFSFVYCASSWEKRFSIKLYVFSQINLIFFCFSAICLKS